LLPPVVGAVLVSHAAAAGSTFAAAAPQPISAAERAAVEWVADYLARGPVAWQGRLADGLEVAGGAAGSEAWLRAVLGPAGGSSWRLATWLSPESPAPTAAPSAGVAAAKLQSIQRLETARAAFAVDYPSGLEAIVFFDLTRSGTDGAWKVASVSGWEDFRSATAGATEAASVAKAPVDGPRWQVLQEVRDSLAWLALGVGLALAGTALLFAPGLRRSGRAFGALCALGIAGWAALVLTWGWGGGWGWGRGGAASDAVSRADPGAAGRWSRYAGAREALGRSGAIAELTALRAEVEAGSRWAERIDLGLAQGLLLAGDSLAARSLLESLASVPAHAPLADWLLARIAVEERRETEAALRLDRALRDLPRVDLILSEAVEAYWSTGFEDRALRVQSGLLAGGTREASEYYGGARRLLMESLQANRKAAAGCLREAFALAPLPRGQLLAEPAVVYLLREGSLRAEFDLKAIAEPMVMPDDLGREPIRLPIGFRASVAGREVWVEGAGARLIVPGGSRVAPRETTVEDAVSRLARADDWWLSGWNRSRRATPQGLGEARRRLERAVSALARRNQWDSIVEMTQPFASRPAVLGSSATLLRGEALYRRGGAEDAIAWLAEATRQHVGGVDAELYFALARYLREQGRLDLAIRATERAEAAEPSLLRSNLPRLYLDRALERSSAVRESEHFLLRVPEDSRSPFQLMLVGVIEREWARVRRWVPAQTRPGRKIEINLYPFGDFMRLVSGGVALGLFDGKVRLPFADIPSLEETVVRVYGHEISHAMLADLTNGRAPVWFHEGLAQTAEAWRAQVNPIADAEAKGTLLAFGLLESVLQNPIDSELVMLAYEQSTWAVQFIEARWGLGTIHRLIGSFGRGADTATALREVLGLSAEEFDAELRRWSRTPGGQVRGGNEVTYEKEAIRTLRLGQ
jgi:tetratricopeptide (TPR) repeat protein